MASKARARMSRSQHGTQWGLTEREKERHREKRDEKTRKRREHRVKPRYSYADLREVWHR